MNFNSNETGSMFNMPVIVNGNILGNNINHEEVILSKEELEYLVSIGYNKTEDDSANEFAGIEGLENQISALFAIHKIDAAWEAITDHIQEISFVNLTQTPFFQLDRSAIAVYKYLYDNGQIDDNTYAYFNVASGSFFDADFLYKFLGDCHTGEEVLAKVHSAFNGIEPSQIGMINYTPELRSVLEGAIEADEDLSSYILGIGASIDFPNSDLIAFMKAGHIKKELVPILALCVSTKNDAEGNDDEIMKELWDYVVDNGLEKEIEFVSTTMLNSFLKYLHATNDTDGCVADEYYETLISVLVTSPAFIKYPRTTLNTLHEDVLKNINSKGHVANYISGEDMVYAYGLRAADLFNIDAAFIMSPVFLTAHRIVYNKVLKQMYVGAFDGDSHYFDIFDFNGDAEETIKDFVAKNAWIFDSEATNDEIFGRCNSRAEYEELRLSLLNTWKQIKVAVR